MKLAVNTLCAVLFFLLCNFASAASSKIGILVFDGFLTSDVTAPVEVFGAATKKAWFSSYSVVTIATTKNKKVKSEEGLTVIADYSIYDDLNIDVLIVPSSYDMGTVLNDKNVVTFVQKVGKNASWMASNCSGAELLGKAGVLDGKKATTWAGGEKDLQKNYPKINVQIDQNLVIDNGVITSNGGPVSYQAAFALLAKLSSPTFSKEVSEYIGFSRLISGYKDSH